MAYSSRKTFDFTRDLLRDNYDPNQHESPKYGDEDLPRPDVGDLHHHTLEIHADSDRNYPSKDHG